MTDDTVLETARLRLRHLTRHDVDALGEVLGDARGMVHYPAPFDRDMTMRWIEWNLELYRTHGYGLWAVVLKADGSLIGDCGLTVQEVEGARDVEIGYHIARAMRGQGLATEAARACRDYAFDRLGLNRLIAIIDPRNAASRRVAEKLGMTLEKQVVKEARPQLVYALSRAAPA